MTAGTEFELLQRVIAVGKFTCKNVVEVALREAELSLKEFEQRVPKQPEAAAATRQMITGML